jgi:hypothetical protein
VRSLSIKEQQLGADHPAVATSLNNLALLYKAQGRYSEAKPLYTQTLTICVNVLGEIHPHTQTVWDNFRYLMQQAVEAGRAGELSDHLGTQAVLREMMG